MQVQWFVSYVLKTTNEILTCVYIGRADYQVRFLFVSKVNHMVDILYL